MPTSYGQCPFSITVNPNAWGQAGEGSASIIALPLAATKYLAFRVNVSFRGYFEGSGEPSLSP